MTPYNHSLFSDKVPFCAIIEGDSRNVLSKFKGKIDLIVTSPPYADARKKHYDSIHPNNFAEWLTTFHQPIWDALKESGSLIINIKDKAVNGVRHRYVWQTIDKLASLGWKCIDDYIWHKTNPMPGYWPTRLRDGWEYCFHLTKTLHFFMNQEAVRQPIGNWVKTRLAKLGKNDLKRHNSDNKSGFGRDISKWLGQTSVLPSNVISLPLVGKNKGHPAVFPPELPEFFIKLLCPLDGIVADPFAGSGMTGIAAMRLNRNCILIDNDPKYCQIALKNLQNENENDIFSVEFLKDSMADGKLFGKLT